MSKKSSDRSPWSWIPTLYVAEGLPYFAVNTLTVLLYTRMGVGPAEMALYTGWLYLPWVIKPFWSPFVDIIRTKRWWTVTMQLLIAIAMASVALFLPGNTFLLWTLAAFWFMAFFSATHDIAADGFYMLALDAHEQAAYVGVRSTFYRIASIIGQGGLVMIAGKLEESTGSVPTAWSIVFVSLSVLFLLLFLYHTFILPKPAADVPAQGKSARDIVRNFGKTFVTFAAKPHILSALGFMLLYRLPEALCLKLVQPFLVTARDAGGLGLSTWQVGFVNGTVGVVALLAGGIVGGLAISRYGLKRCLWPMALSLTLPCALYLCLAAWQPESFLWINLAVGTEQFGYGFGFTAYMLYLIYFSRGEMQTSHYAFCTAFMALGMMLPGMLAGWLFELVGSYTAFFILIMASCLATFIACSLVKIDPSFGTKVTDN